MPHRGIFVARFLQNFQCICGVIFLIGVQNLVKGFRSYRGLTTRGEGAFSEKKFLTPPSGKAESEGDMFQTAQNWADLLYHHAKFGGAGNSYAANGAKSSMFFCLFCVRHALWKDRVCECHVT